MPKLTIEKERTSITLPIGMKDKAAELGVNMSYHAGVAIQKAIDVQEKALREEE